MSMWVFGYGSLVWNPGFEVEEQLVATLPGYARSFCMRSIHHRGTVENPGLVLALDAVEGAQCHGVGMSVSPCKRNEVIEYLRERELVSAAYLEKRLPIRLADGRSVEAVTYVIDPRHVQYCGTLELEEQARIIAAAHGGRGPNSEYLHNTFAHLRELGIDDPDLEWLSRRVRALSG
ncbi:gamma-glutamylcyclotransferase [Roseovarius sp. TE539]|uniref:gamma-glutamylcyclotransferase n=1 Tax=Roseovarius sp. TE539 TaxID=2249812 RepID=UPI000DDFE180|nr:gamma-glutamylcyclotransferase [Roseovarius sp. TE539]RBI72691.1 gamma-glutamylcyclotransferase [Roseovarius sp. TE539]